MKITATLITYLLVGCTVFQTAHAQTDTPLDPAGDQICVACENCAAAGDECVTDTITDISCLPNVCELVGGEEFCLACEICQNNIPDCDLADVLEASCNLCGEDVAGAVVDIFNAANAGVGAIQEVAASGACFSELSTVLVDDGSLVQMKNLQVGDRILSPTTGSFEQVYSFGHWHPTKEAEFLQIHHVQQDQQPLEVTRDHLIYVQGQPAPVPAHTVKVGDILKVAISSTNSSKSAVTQITSVQRRGIYAPLTKSGALVVDGVVASSYIQITSNNQQQLPFVSDHTLIHATLAPFRMFCDGVSLFGGSLCDKYHSTSGMPYYVHYGWQLLQFLSHCSNTVVATLGWSLVLVATAVFQLTESLLGRPLLLVCLVGVAMYTTKKTTKKYT